MAYGKKHIKSSPATLFKFKLLRFLVKSFPLNYIRIWAIRSCGFAIGNKVYIANGLTITMFNARSSCQLIIGNRVAIAPNVTLLLASDANWSNLNHYIPPVEGKIVIEDDCWIGAGAIIMPNVNIGKMSVVAAGAIVTKDVQPYTIVAGNPAIKIKSIEQILAI